MVIVYNEKIFIYSKHFPSLYIKVILYVHMKSYYPGFICAAQMYAIIAAVLFVTPHINAQENSPLSSLKLELKLAHNINDNQLDEYWNSTNGAEFLVEFPFYTGIVQAGFLLKKYNGTGDKHPSFTGNFIFFGMGEDIKLPLKFELFGGIKAGYFLMTFDSDSLTSYEKFESELMLGADFRISYPVMENLFLLVETDIAVLMTHERIKFYNVSAGAAYKFNSPNWIKELFN